MPDLSLPFGPWERVSSGVWNNHPVSIYVNGSKMILMTLFEKEGEEIKGIMVLLKKPVLLLGDSGKLASQSRDLTVVEKVSRERRSKFLLVDSTPSYVKYSQTELMKAVKKQYTELDGIYAAISDFASEAGVKLEELKDDDAEALLGDPLAMFAIGGGGSFRESKSGALGKSTKTTLGIDAGRKPVEVGLNSLRKTFVIGEDESQRLHALHVIAEGALVNSVPCLIFGTKNALIGLALPNKDASSFKSFGMSEVTNGFPFKTYSIGKGLLVDLRFVDLNSFAQATGFDKNEEVVKVLEKAMPKAATLDDVVTNLKALPESREIPKSAMLKAIRVMKVIQKAWPSTFGQNTMAELLDLAKTQVGRAAYVDASKQGPEIRLLLLTSLLSQLTAAGSFGVLMVLEEDMQKIPSGVKQALEEASNRGVGLALGASHELDLEPLENPSLRIDLIQGTAFATEEGGEKKRFYTRPAYSLCTEMK